ncbi:hypothetical protein T439DRAFT_333859 [Meredithblackwellia eburnea MCA 4105]
MSLFSIFLLLFASSLAVATSSLPTEWTFHYDQPAQHTITLVNKCSYRIRPNFFNTPCQNRACNSEERKEAKLHAFKETKVGYINPGHRKSWEVPDKWEGRVYDKKEGQCGEGGELCSHVNFDLDNDSIWIPHAYYISNMGGFTNGLQVKADGCDTVTCRTEHCSCADAYPFGDPTGCGADYPVKGCEGGATDFTIVFCP